VDSEWEVRSSSESVAASMGHGARLSKAAGGRVAVYWAGPDQAAGLGDTRAMSAWPSQSF